MVFKFSDLINSTSTKSSTGSYGGQQAEQQYADDGRGLSDTTHPDYDAATDPDLRLRVTNTQTESIATSIREETRRRLRRSSKLFTSPLSSNQNDPKSGRSRSQSLFSRVTLRGRGRSNASDTTNVDGAKEVNVELGRAELDRLRTQTNAASESKEAARRQERQDHISSRKERQPRSWKNWTGYTTDSTAKKVVKKERRTVYINIEGGGATNPKGYERNKVRTSKYTLVTFLPKNLSEQFRRIANMYFLLLVILQLFPIFGAAAPQIAMLPLVTILTLTAIKDGVEDYRRNQLDDGVNNSPVTRLGDWKNVNAPVNTKSWWEFWKRSERKSISRGVRRLRQKEGGFDSGFLYETETLDFPTDLSSSISNATLNILPTESNRQDSTLYPPSAFTSPNLDKRSGLSFKSNSTANWERTLWKKILVGDVLLLQENDQIPADVIVLSSSDPEGVCFVETKNLDGETNLKPRKALRATMKISNEEDIEKAQFSIESEAPHANLYSYNGVLKYRVADEIVGMEHPITEGRDLKMGGEKTEPISINELLLRGCALRNTKWVICMVLFTGADTKIMMNQGETPSKRSKIEKETNFNVLVNFLVLMIFCSIVAIADGILLGGALSSGDLYGADSSIDSVIIAALTTFGSSLILFQNIVPISLVITVELVKTIQAYFIYQDIDMYYELLDHPTVPKTWNISDDLGQIEYIFSDKTGTLTQNVMQFQRCAVAGVAYGEGVTESMLGAAKREGRDTSAFDPTQIGHHLALQKEKMLSIMQSAFQHRYLQSDQLTLISPSLAADLIARSNQSFRLHAFWTALALCHTVLPDRPDTLDPTRVDYKAESPDEAALVSAARDVGFVFLSRTTAQVEIEVLGQIERYVPLRVLEFNSSRKRMSTLFRTPDGRILLICKGADSVIYERLSPGHDLEVIQSTTKNLEDFSTAGLRTLCISSRYVTEEEFASWSQIYDVACAAIDDREELIERACEIIERDLTILGATALEDKLQEGVPDAIAQLHKAGLKLWILTGDKLQTAIEIAFSCNLLSTQMEIMILSADSEEGTRAQIEAGLDKISRNDSSGGYAVVINGETLSFALEVPLKALFLDLTTQCETVVCCRVSPSQKALTVKLVKDGKGAMTLAIGDGANDVAMIQEAHIGVGIAGLEGAQASMSADYAFGQFRYLTKLLLVHGRWCNIRVGDMHANFFYKNLVWTFTLFLYQIYCNFDATLMYDYSLLMLFNLVFTSLPVAILGISDQDVNAKTSQAVPQLYRRGMLGLEYTRPKFFIFMLDGLYQSCIAFYIPYLVYSGLTTSSIHGHGFDVLEFGTTIAACAVTVVNLFVGLHIRYWTWMVFVIIIASILSFYLWITIFSLTPGVKFQYVIFHIFPTLNFWLCILIVSVAAILPRFVYRYVHSAYFPFDSDIIREMEVLAPSNEKDNLARFEDGLVPDDEIKAEFSTLPSRSNSLDNLPTLFVTGEKNKSLSPPRATRNINEGSRDDDLSLDLISLGTPGAVGEDMRRAQTGSTPIKSLPSGLSGYESQMEDADETTHEDRLWKA